MSVTGLDGQATPAPATSPRLARQVYVAARPPRRGAPRRSIVLSSQLLVVIAVLAAWQWLPTVHSISSHVGVLNRDFIASPSSIAGQIGSLVGGKSASTFWPAIGDTLRSTIIGGLIGSAVGMLGGLLLSQSQFAAKVLKPFITAFNATPLIAFIPIIVVIFGITPESSILSAALLSVFVVFFNAIEGGRSVRSEVLSNAKLLGATRFSIMVRVRFPYVLAWTFTALPVAISFALVGAVATEFLVGVPGIGKLLTLALSFGDPRLTFALAVLLGVSGALLVAIVSVARSRVLHWWENS